MITNFETLTIELTDEELQVIPILIKGFKTHEKENPITEPNIIENMNIFLKQNTDLKIKITGVRLRKMVNYIRVNALIPLMATSQGYFVSYDQKEIESQIKSLYQRAKSISNAADGLLLFTKGHGVTP